MAGYTGAAGTNDGNWKGGGGSLGLRTGNTWHGNTAFGPSGGMATGYGTRDMRSLNAAGMGPTMGMFSNFRNLNGNPMFGGMLGNQGFRAPNANAAHSQALTAFLNRQKPVGSVEPAATPITQRPLPPLQPPVQPPVRVPLNKEMMPMFFGGTPNPTWGPITDVFTQPLQRDLANRNWTGNPVNIKGVIGGQGVPGYSSGGSGYRTYTGAGRKGDRGGNAGY